MSGSTPASGASRAPTDEFVTHSKEKRVSTSRRPRWGVLSEDGTVYGVGRWKNGGERHRGALWLAMRECLLLRRAGERNAKVVRRAY